MNLLKNSLKFYHTSIIRHNMINNTIIQNTFSLINKNIPLINPLPHSPFVKQPIDDIDTAIEFKGRNSRIPRRVHYLI